MLKSSPRFFVNSLGSPEGLFRGSIGVLSGSIEALGTQVPEGQAKNHPENLISAHFAGHIGFFMPRW